MSEAARCVECGELATTIFPFVGAVCKKHYDEWFEAVLTEDWKKIIRAEADRR